MDHKFSLFDAPLVYNFGEISTSVSADLRKVFDDTLVQKAPVCAVVCSPCLFFPLHASPFPPFFLFKNPITNPL